MGQAVGSRAALDQRFDRHIDEEGRRGRLWCGGECRGQAGRLDLALQAGHRRAGEQFIRVAQARARGKAAQRLVPEHGAITEADQRLQRCPDAPGDEDFPDADGEIVRRAGRGFGWDRQCLQPLTHPLPRKARQCGQGLDQVPLQHHRRTPCEEHTEQRVAILDGRSQQRSGPKVQPRRRVLRAREVRKHRNHPRGKVGLDGRGAPLHGGGERRVSRQREAHRSDRDPEHFLDTGGVIIGNAKPQDDDFIPPKLAIRASQSMRCQTFQDGVDNVARATGRRDRVDHPVAAFSRRTHGP